MTFKGKCIGYTEESSARNVCSHYTTSSRCAFFIGRPFCDDTIQGTITGRLTGTGFVEEVNRKD